ncbi:MAG: hypothetical protein M3457_06435 [Chloroflexota bacterium]|nr:hypothetical protein [Chloroflexota bacterium]
MPEDRSRPAGSGEAAGSAKIPHRVPATDDPDADFSAANASAAGSSSRNQPSGKTAPEQAEEELERQLDTGEENPT